MAVPGFGQVVNREFAPALALAVLFDPGDYRFVPLLESSGVVCIRSALEFVCAAWRDPLGPVQTSCRVAPGTKRIPIIFDDWPAADVTDIKRASGRGGVL